MMYAGRVSVSYGQRLTRLGRLRELDEGYAQLKSNCDHSERLWQTSGHTRDERLHACSQVIAALSSFVTRGGADLYTQERLNDLLVALGELISGRRSALLSPSPVHPSTFSASDLMQQAMAQVCVDLLRGAGAGAADARKIVARLFDKNDLPKFGEAKLRLLNSRLKGRGNTQDPALEMYKWASGHAETIGAELGVWPITSVPKAKRLAATLIGLAKRRDHRHDFFFDSRADSSPVP